MFIAPEGAMGWGIISENALQMECVILAEPAV